MRSRNWLPWVVAGLVIVALLGAAGVAVIGRLIGSGVDEAATLATAEHPGDRVDALIAYVDSPGHPVKLRNRAVWALGQLGDGRALPVLEKHYTGGACDHERLICQHELQKALALCRGGKNLSAFVWR